MSISLYESVKTTHFLAYFLGLAPFTTKTLLAAENYSNHIKHMIMWYLNIIICLLVCFEQITGCFYYLNQSGKSFLLFVLFSVKLALISVIYASAIFSRKQIVQVIQTIQNLDNFLQRKTSRYAWTPNKCLILNLLIWLTESTYVLILPGTNKCKFPNIHNTLVAVVCSSHLSGYLLEILQKLTSLKDYLQQLVSTFNTTHGNIEEELQRFSAAYTKIYESSRLFNQCLQGPIVMLLLYWFIQVLTFLTMIISYHMNFLILLLGFCEVLLHFVLIFVCIHFCSALDRKVTQTSKLMHGLKLRKGDEYLAITVELISHQLYFQRIRFTILQMFDLDYKIIYSVFLAACTYTMTLYQIV